MIDGWQKLLDGERDELRAHLEDEEDIMNTQELIHSECLTSDQQQQLYIGDTVRVPGGKVGEVVSQCFTFPEDGVEGCLVDVPGVGAIAYNTSDLEIVTLESVWQELQDTDSYVEAQARAASAELGLEIEA